MLNTAGFIVLAGTPEAWDDEMRQKCRPGRIAGTVDSDDMIRVQGDQHQRGRRTAQLIRTVYGWSVRYASALDRCALMFPGEAEPATPAACILWGRTWAEEDPMNREFISKRDSLLRVAQEPGEIEKMSGGERAVVMAAVTQAMTP